MVERNGTRPCGHRSAKVSLLLVLACVASLAGCDATGDSNDPAGPAAEKPAAAVDASTSAASETSKGQSAAAVTEADPSDYTSFLSETDVKAETPELAEVKKVTVKYPGGRVKSEFSLNVFKNGPPAFHGTYKEWYENGQVWKEGEYVNGRKIGAWKFWAEDGKLLKSGAYVDGHPDGKFTYYGPGEVAAAASNPTLPVRIMATGSSMIRAASTFCRSNRFVTASCTERWSRTFHRKPGRKARYKKAARYSSSRAGNMVRPRNGLPTARCGSSWSFATASAMVRRRNGTRQAKSSGSASFVMASRSTNRSFPASLPRRLAASYCAAWQHAKPSSRERPK